MDGAHVELCSGSIRPFLPPSLFCWTEQSLDRLTTFELFTRIVDRRSFSAAAAGMRVSRPVATAAITALEHRLGTRLLQRSTRNVTPTVEGEVYYQRCLAILTDMEDADRGEGGAVAGRLSVDVAGNLARTAMLPALTRLPCPASRAYGPSQRGRAVRRLGARRLRLRGARRRARG